MGKVIIITGVSGSGKTTVGMALADVLKVSFVDGDVFHPAANVAKMSSGIPLNDEDRLPFLQSINEFIKGKLLSESLVIACSALKEKYRELLIDGIDPSQVEWVHLQGSFDTIYQRMIERKGHFMGSEMLRSQFDAYETPAQGILVNVNKRIDQIMHHILSAMDSRKSDVGLIGLGVMGTALARNIAGKGFSISIYNRHVNGKEEGIAKKMAELYPELIQSNQSDDLEGFVASLQKPRRIIVMVNAGKAVDDVILQLLPLLSGGDTIVDGGNSFYKDTVIRQELLKQQGVHFVGAGVSGGEEGALMGPSIMPGGSREGFDMVKDILFAIAAKNERGETCCDFIGDGGAGHFVKMVHNGIEYAEMQLIAEVYSHLRYDQQKEPADIAAVFDAWNKGEASSYLLGITVDILKFRDIDGSPLIDRISDMAGSKGTGSWTTITACELGVPVPAMAEALYSRYLSSFRQDRKQYADIYDSMKKTLNIDSNSLLHLFMFCRIMNHYQGIKLIKETSDHFQWDIDTSVLLKTWSGGCIIRSALLGILRNGWNESGGDVLQHPYITELINKQLPGIKENVSRLVNGSLAFPVISSSLEYFKGLISPRSNAYLIQAQRDYFGAHTYQRLDDPSGLSHHTKWY